MVIGPTLGGVASRPARCRYSGDPIYQEMQVSTHLDNALRYEMPRDAVTLDWKRFNRIKDEMCRLTDSSF